MEGCRGDSGGMGVGNALRPSVRGWRKMREEKGNSHCFFSQACYFLHPSNISLPHSSGSKLNSVENVNGEIREAQSCKNPEARPVIMIIHDALSACPLGFILTVWTDASAAGEDSYSKNKLGPLVLPLYPQISSKIAVPFAKLEHSKRAL